MITKEVAESLKHGDMLHENGCSIERGKRGKLTLKIVRWRVNGKCKLWKTKPGAFEVPIKYGFGRSRSDYSYLNDFNCECFHLASECGTQTQFEKEWREKHGTI